jgi:hypothetical protein
MASQYLQLRCNSGLTLHEEIKPVYKQILKFVLLLGNKIFFFILKGQVRVS